MGYIRRIALSRAFALFLSGVYFSAFAAEAVAAPRCRDFGELAGGWAHERELRAASWKHARDMLHLYTGRFTRGLDSQSFAIFERVRLNPNATLAEAERKHLEEKGLIHFFGRYRELHDVFKKWNHRRAPGYRSAPAPIQRGAITGTGNFLRMMLVPVVPDIRYRFVYQSYMRFLDNPGMKISDLPKWRLRMIRRAGLEDDLRRFVDDLETYRVQYGEDRARRWRATLRKLYAVAAVTGGVVALNQQGHKTITVEDSLNPKHPEGMRYFAGQMELIYTSCPDIPVMVRKDSLIFAFTPGGEIGTMVKRDALDIPKADAQEIKESSMMPIDDKAYLEKTKGYVPLTMRTIRYLPCFRDQRHIRVRINLSAEEIRKVFGALREEARKKYDPSIRERFIAERRAYKILEELGGPWIPPLVDIDPGTVLAMLKARKLIGSDAIGEIYYANPKKDPPTFATRVKAAGWDALWASSMVLFYRFLLGGELLLDAFP